MDSCRRNQIAARNLPARCTIRGPNASSTTWRYSSSGVCYYTR
jgi:hypothetical protein